MSYTGQWLLVTSPSGQLTVVPYNQTRQSLPEYDHVTKYDHPNDAALIGIRQCQTKMQEHRNHISDLDHNIEMLLRGPSN